MSGRTDLIVEGRIATLAGDAGFGWVEAIGIAGSRVVAAGSRADVQAAVDHRTGRLVLGPDEVAIPGMTDAHLHLAETSVAASQLDLSRDQTIAVGLARIREAHLALADPAAWLLGHGWDSDRWGGWPTADDLEETAPGRAIALWAHDHHSLWTSRAAFELAGIGPGTPDPDGGEIRRRPDGTPTGVVNEAAAGMVAGRIPPPSADDLVAVIPRVARELLSLGVVAVHDPGDLVADAALSRAFAAYARLDDAGGLPLRVHASLRQDALETAKDRGLRSGMPLGSAPDGRARVGWLKLFADGSLGSRTAALLEPFSVEPDRPLGRGRERGIFTTRPSVLADLAARAADAGIATQIHAIGDAGLRAALDALGPHAGRHPLIPRVEHVQLIDPADLPRFSRLGIAASIQPVHLRSDAAQARRLWGSRAEPSSYRWRSLADSGALIPFGTDAPVEPFDPWPGIAIAVTRADTSWPSGTPAFGIHESLTLARALRAACLDAALAAGEADRGRLTPGHRADLVVLPSRALDEPVVVGGPLATARPRLVLMDGRTVFEA